MRGHSELNSFSFLLCFPNPFLISLLNVFTQKRVKVLSPFLAGMVRSLHLIMVPVARKAAPNVVLKINSFLTVIKGVSSHLLRVFLKRTISCY